MTRKKKGAEPQNNVPENIQRLVEKFRKQRLDDELDEWQRKRAREREDSLLRASRLKEGLGYANQVFGWAEALRNSDVGQELMEMSHPPTAYKGIIFFDAHIDGLYQWVGLGVSLEGLFWCLGGRYSAPSRTTVKSASELAAAVDTRVLKTACEWIENGKVWECIERRFDYLKK